MGRLAGHHRQGLLLQRPAPPASACSTRRRRSSRITDYLGLQPWATFAAHGAAKAAQIHLVKDARPRVGARPACACAEWRPGRWTWTTTSTARPRCAPRPRVAAERLVAPGDIGAAVRFCLETDGLTGVNIAVDNGSLVTS